VEIPYEAVGDWNLDYRGDSFAMLLVGFLVGPTLTELRPIGAEFDVKRIQVRHRRSAELMSVIPLWLVGVPFWWKSEQERFLEALIFLKENGGSASQAVR
jgi:hypothetical protein